MKNEKKICGFLYSKNMANFEALHYVISSSINLVFLKSDVVYTRKPCNSHVKNAQKLSKNCVKFWNCHQISHQRRNCDKSNHWHHQAKNKIHPKAFWGVCSGGLDIRTYMWRVPKMTQKFIAWGVFATHKQATDGATFYSGSQ